MALDLLKRDEAGAPLTRAQHDTNFTNIETEVNAKAPTASPTFTGTPAAPTAAQGTNTTQIATTAFVLTESKRSQAAKTGAYTLVAGDHGSIIPVTSAVTITVPAAATLGAGFSCDIYADGAAVTLDGPGGTNVALAAGDAATVFVTNSKVLVSKGAATVIS